MRNTAFRGERQTRVGDREILEETAKARGPYVRVRPDDSPGRARRGLVANTGSTRGISPEPANTSGQNQPSPLN